MWNKALCHLIYNLSQSSLLLDLIFIQYYIVNNCVTCEDAKVTDALSDFLKHVKNK